MKGRLQMAEYKIDMKRAEQDAIMATIERAVFDLRTLTGNPDFPMEAGPAEFVRFRLKVRHWLRKTEALEADVLKRTKKCK